MEIAYKFLKLPNGILVVFERSFEESGEKVTVEFVTKNGKSFIKLGQNHLIPSDFGLLDWLKETRRIYIAFSGHFEPEIRICGTVEFDDLIIGRILAYSELAPKLNPLQETITEQT